MDIGKLKNNTQFYDGFEDDHEVTLSYVNSPEFNIHIYGGYIYDIVGKPTLDGNGWKGFTRDYNQLERSFGDSDYIIKDVKEYLDDLLSYSDNQFEDKDSEECFKLLIKFLEYAQKNKYQILVHYF